MDTSCFTSSASCTLQNSAFCASNCVIPVLIGNRPTELINSVSRRPTLARCISKVVSDSLVPIPASLPDSPKMFVLNACSPVKPHAFEQLKAHMSSYTPDVVVVTETHMNSRHSSDLFFISSYKLFRNDRVKRKGGELCVYIKESLTSIVLSVTHALSHSETLWIRYWFNHSKDN